MLKNFNPEELKNISQNSENVDDSQSVEENGIEPLCSFDISLNNGQKATLVIKEDDNYEQKVNNFCETYKISPQDRQVLLQKVKEELEMYSNVDKNNNKNDNNNINSKELINNEINEEPKDKIPNNRNLIIGNINYKPNEQKKLDHILNESESFSLSSSVSQSQNNLNNIKNKFINNNIQSNNNDMKNINKTTINNNINKNQNSPQKSAFIQVPNTFLNFPSNIPNQNSQKFYNVNDLNKNQVI